MKYFCHALTVLLSVFLFCTFGFLSWAAPFEVPANLPPAPGARELNLLLRHLAVQRAEIINIQRELVLRPALNPEDGGEGDGEQRRKDCEKDGSCRPRSERKHDLSSGNRFRSIISGIVTLRR